MLQLMSDSSDTYAEKKEVDVIRDNSSHWRVYTWQSTERGTQIKL